MVEITELNREPASTVSTLTASTEVTSPSVDATDVTSETVTATTEVTSPSVKADALEATSSITDPEGNTFTSLSDPVRVTEEASTFNESDVTVINNDTTIKNGSIKLSGANVIEDVEDNDITVTSPNWSGWNGDTGDISAVSSPALSGTYSLEINASNNRVVVDTDRNTPTTDSFEFLAQIDSQTGNTGDSTRIKPGKDFFGWVEFKQGNDDLIWYDGGTEHVLISYSINTTYKIRLDWNFSSNEVTIFVDGNNKGTYPMGSVSDFDQIELDVSSTGSGGIINLYVDELKAGSKKTNGDALVSFDSGVPTDIDSWDLSTFQRTLDNETVSVDVEDSNGNVLESDISKDTDISAISTSSDVKFRANLSRNDTANNPTVDYLARRFTR